MLKITVPASSANLGAGFDALGLALTLYNRVWMEEADGCHIAATDGAAIPTDESNMIYATARRLYERCGHPFRGAADPAGKQHSHDPGAGQLLRLPGGGPAGGQHSDGLPRLPR